MTVEQIEKEYCDRCVNKEHCHIPCIIVTSRQLEDSFNKKENKQK